MQGKLNSILLALERMIPTGITVRTRETLKEQNNYKLLSLREIPTRITVRTRKTEKKIDALLPMSYKW